MTSADEVIELMSKRGGDAYFGEPVSQLEHALQCASHATQAGSEKELVLAALLHDVGHLLHDMGESAANHGIDTRHEEAGYQWLLSRYGAAVAEPVRLHVPAKRYLCAVDPEYFAGLSPASMQSLELQGGAFTEAEAAAFEALPYYRQAIALRRWDDLAKIPGIHVPGIEAYLEILR